MRGNRRPCPYQGKTHRSIPACAGEPGHCVRDWAIYRVYPRLCGGTDKPSLCRRSVLGLSPPVRGNPKGAYSSYFPVWSIPACAGEPSSRSDALMSDRVYPRLCGGTSQSWWFRDSHKGLSPPVRGNPISVQIILYSPRSIPACAGEPARC